MPAGRVLITPRSLRPQDGDHHPAVQRLLAADLEPVYPPGRGPFGPEVLRSLVPGVQAAIIGLDGFDRSVVAAGRELRVVARYGTGYDRVDVAACTEHGVVVTNTPDANTVAVAEYTLALMLAAARRVVEHHTGLLAGSWEGLPGVELSGRRLGLIGLGRIGAEVARRARALGMQVGYYDVLRKDPADEEVLGVQYLPLERLLSWVDILSLHAPQQPGAPPLLGEQELGRLRPGAILINTARGELIDEEALLKALHANRLQAAIDVFRQEPLPADHPLRRAPNLVLSPHAAARTREATARMAESAVQSVLDVLAGRRPAHVVNPELYRATVETRRTGLAP